MRYRLRTMPVESIKLDDKEAMLKYTLNRERLFYKIILGIKLLHENGITFLFSPSLMKPSSRTYFLISNTCTRGCTPTSADRFTLG